MVHNFSIFDFVRSAYPNLQWLLPDPFSGLNNRSTSRNHYLSVKALRFLITTILAIGFSHNSTAQTVNHFSGWAAIFNTTKLNSKFSLHLEGQIRSGNEWKEALTLIFRTGLIYNIKSNQSATVGYAIVGHHRTIDGVSGWGPEHRIWEQYIFTPGLTLHEHFVSIQNRFRLEQRFISTSVVNDDKLETGGYNFSQRLRYFVRAIFPFSATPDRKFQNGPFLSLQNEIFVNLSESSATNGKFFDQNRAYISIGNRFSPKYDIEIGYMYQFISGKGNAKTNNNIIQLAAYLRL